MSGTSNPYCAALGISAPRFADAARSPDANYYSLLLVALFERGAPMTLADVALRLEEIGLAPVEQALASLKRCKPARAPVYRDGDHYALDPHDDEVRFWLFRLGLVPPRAAPLQTAPPVVGPFPDPDQPLTRAALDEAWREGGRLRGRPSGLRLRCWTSTTRHCPTPTSPPSWPREASGVRSAKTRRGSGAAVPS